MSNGEQSNGSVWPVITIILAIVVIGVAAWAMMLSGKNKDLEKKVAALETRVGKIEKSARNAAREAAAATGKNAPATAPGTGRRGRPATTTTTTAPVK